MSPELDARLCEQYPKIFSKRHDLASRFPIAWGIGCCDCWYDLLDALCAGLQGTTQHGDPQVVAFDVKQKFGGLRFYVDGLASSRQQGMITVAENLSLRICAGHCGRVRQRRTE